MHGYHIAPLEASLYPLVFTLFLLPITVSIAMDLQLGFASTYGVQ